MAKNITIIGAGVVGMATASYLLRDGHHVTVVDMRPPGEYCSFGNAGILSPGSCVPFGMPGTLAKVPGYLLDPLGPLSIKPAYALRALPWLLRFIAASRRARIDPIADALRALLKQTFDAWTPLTQWAGVPEIIRRTGYLVVYESEQVFRSDALAWKIRRDRGVICEDLDPARIRELEPALRGIYRCGVFLPEQGYVTSPLRLTRSLAAQFQRDGGTILQRKVLDIELGPAGPRALTTDAGALAVETLVLCAGVHSNAFSTKLGSNVPLESQRGYHVHFEHPTVTLQRPVMSGEGKFFATPMEDGLRVAGSVEFGGIDAEPSYGRADALKLQAGRMLPELSGSNVTQWMGHRPCMPDSLPVIGRSPSFANTYFAFGHGHVGLCGGAPTGRLIADLVAGRPPNIDIVPFRVNRF
jgi:D-amino-acid dehydrogenase